MTSPHPHATQDTSITSPTPTQPSPRTSPGAAHHDTGAAPPSRRAAPAVGTVAVIGDLHGHLDAATDLLTTLGADPDTWQLPEHLTVICVGDALHKGPHSAELLARIDDAVTANAGRWIQLWGNHEASAISARPTSWAGLDDPAEVRETLERWWRTGTAKIAAAITVDGGRDVVVTHAGVSVGWWERHGAPTDATECAAALNAHIGDCPRTAFGGGRALTGGRPRTDAGPLWCDTAAEGWAGWQARGEAPFDQIHGHGAPWSWRHRRWVPHTPAALRTAVTVDAATRHTRLRVGEAAITSIDTAPDATGLTGTPLAVIGDAAAHT